MKKNYKIPFHREFCSGVSLFFLFLLFCVWVERIGGV